MPNIMLTTEFIRAGLTVPEGQSKVEYCDQQVRGMYIAVSRTSEGRGTYYLRWKNPQGKTAHTKIGRTDEITLAEARKRALALKADIFRGADPQEQLRQRKAVPTFSAYWTEQYEPVYSVRKRSWRNDLAMYRNRLKEAFGAMRLDAITRQEVQRFHVSLKEQGLSGATADLHLQLIRHVLGTAVSNEVIARNVAAKIPLFRESPHKERYLKDDELVRLLTVLKHDSNRTVSAIVLLLLATGMRVSEVLTAEWRHVNLAAKTLTIEASNSKSKKRQHVPLNEVSLDVIKNLPRRQGQEYLFQSSRGGQMKHVSKVWQRLREEAGIPDVRLHDLRHTAASYMVSSGQSLFAVQQVLRHADSKTTLIYSHLSNTALQEAADTVAKKIADAMSAEPKTADVVPIKPRAA